MSSEMLYWRDGIVLNSWIGSPVYTSHPFFPPPSISVAPGYYGELMNSWERPRGIYPISMAMLDLLLSGFPAGDSRDMLACVVLVMREMFAGSHSWRYRHSTNRDQIGGWKWWVRFNRVL